MIIYIVLLLILISIWVGFYQLVKQQGRILLRLDALEYGANRVDHQPSAPIESVDSDALSIGTVFPKFEFPDLGGKVRSIDGFHGSQILLINWSFDCGFCEAISGDLAGLETDLKKRNIEIVLLASGDEAFNRKHAASHGLNSHILLLKDREVPKPFQHQGTPVAYFLDEQGRIAEPFASGADDVLALIRRIATPKFDYRHERHKLKSERPLTDSVIERNGLKAGTPAPDFRLPDLEGHFVSLNQFRDRRVLLVFSDPNCGPCDELAPHLARIHEEHIGNGLSVLLVGRGSAEENRIKAKQFGFQFPVVLQDRWKVSKQYGIFATPVAFLIEENGVIAKDVAVGIDAILALAGDGVRRARRVK